ncbi:hypothetical protein ARTHRO9AX_220291 [Arthrobacter sp. 9AX]|nr:hypothetical protein ARTHRO9AX_220291 [Arthrobacter sp. 9AX]
MIIHHHSEMTHRNPAQEVPAFAGTQDLYSWYCFPVLGIVAHTAERTAAEGAALGHLGPGRDPNRHLHDFRPCPAKASRPHARRVQPCYFQERTHSA